MTSIVHSLGGDLGHHKEVIITLVVFVGGGVVVALRRAGSARVQRDPQRMFSAAQRVAIFRRAGNRCEHKATFGRCTAGPTHADHIYPWSKGGATTLANGAALCARHNLSKGARTPSGIYKWRLERSRRSYFPTGMPCDVVWKVGRR